MEQIVIYLANISKDFSVDDMKKIGFYWYISVFSVDYDAIAVDDIIDIEIVTEKA